MKNLPVGMEKYVDILNGFWQQLETLAADHLLYRSLYPEKVIGCIVITEDIGLGYQLAYSSGLPHRMSKQNRAWRLVHSPSLQVVTAGMPASLHDTVPMTVWEAIELEPYYLGADALQVVEGRAGRLSWYDTALFVYPENQMVPKQTQQFISQVIHSVSSPRILVITKEPLILSDFITEAILVLQ